MRARAVAAVMLCVVLLAGASAAPASPGHGNEGAARGRVGLLIVDHGEPPDYNELTYWSFREFFDHLIAMGLIPSWTKLVDRGTVLTNRNCHGCDRSLDHPPRLMDAWLHGHSGPAVFVPATDRQPAHYVAPGGPGQGEPDIFEQVGLSAWHEWTLMGGRSPNYEQKLAQKRAVISRLRHRFGADLPVRIGYGIDPRIGGGHQGIREAVVALVNRDRVKHIVVAYHGVGFSDIMQTHMIRHEIHHVLEDVAPEVTVSYAKSIGTSRHYVRAVVDEVRREVARLPRNAAVAVHLSGHGLPTTMCGDYDCGADAYHAHSAELFRRTSAAVRAAVRRPGRLGVFRLYGDGATDEDDPGHEVDSPMEALAKRARSGYDYVIDIPYEFHADSRDTLIVLRQGYERPIPDWDRVYESRFTHRGMRVKIGNASFGQQRKVDAFYDVVHRALRAAGVR